MNLYSEETKGALNWLVELSSQCKSIRNISKALIYTCGTFDLIESDQVNTALQNTLTEETDLWSKTLSFENARKTKDITFFYSYLKGRVDKWQRNADSVYGCLDANKGVPDTYPFRDVYVIKTPEGLKIHYLCSIIKLNENFSLLFNLSPSDVNEIIAVIPEMASFAYNDIYNSIFEIDFSISSLEVTTQMLNSD